jgi:hypothetical protein
MLSDSKDMLEDPLNAVNFFDMDMDDEEDEER